MSNAEYIYARVAVPVRIAKRFLHRPDKVGRDGIFSMETPDDAESKAVLTAAVYAESREEAYKLADDLLHLGQELKDTAECLHTFVKNHETEKWEEASPST